MANEWTQITPSVVVPQGYYAGGHDFRGWSPFAGVADGKLWIYEGYQDDPGVQGPRYPYTIYSNAPWTFDPATRVLNLERVFNWRNTTPGNGYNTQPYPENSSDPTPADRHPGVCVIPAGIFIHGGLNNNILGQAPNHPNDTWIYDKVTKRCRLIDPPVRPGNAQGAILTAMVYFPARNCVVLVNAPQVGAEFGQRFTWIFDLGTETYQRLPATPRPASQGGQTLILDQRRGVLRMFGGGGQGGVGNQLWELTPGGTPAEWTWAQLTPSGTPPPARCYHVFLRVESQDADIIYGGAATEGGNGGLTDTYIYDRARNEYRQINSPSAPPASHQVFGAALGDRVYIRTMGLQWWTMQIQLTPPPRAFAVGSDLVVNARGDITVTVTIDGVPRLITITRERLEQRYLDDRGVVERLIAAFQEQGCVGLADYRTVAGGKTFQV